MPTHIYQPALWLVVATLAVCIFAVLSVLAFLRTRVGADPFIQLHYQRQFEALGRTRAFLWFIAVVMTVCGIGAAYFRYKSNVLAVESERARRMPAYNKTKVWAAPDHYLAETDSESGLIAYGRDLIVNTQDYFGEEGLVRPGSINGMNCQNCHLDAGTKPYGNNYFAVESTYPQKRARSGTLETIPKRVNDCFQRSLNGQPIDSTSREMRAILAYLRWLGTGVPKGEKPLGTGLKELALLDRPADPVHGQAIFMEKCASCHGADGQGLPIPESARRYPPLWGDKSFNEAAGLFRLSRFAAYVKANMPFGASYDNPQLTDEEAWDVAAFVNSQPRPKHPFLQTDWPNIAKKPYDHPFGPYADTFPEIQHKLGPFGPIQAAYPAK